MYLGRAIKYKERWRDHRKRLKEGNHENPYLQNAYNKYGKSKFKYELLVECPEELLASEEHYWATLLNVHDDRFGYNIQPTHPDGKIRNSKETIEKIASKNRGQKRSDNTKQLISKINTGKKRNKTVKNKLSKVQRKRGYKPIVILDRDRNFIGKFNTLIEAAEFLECPECNNRFSHALRKKRWYYKKYIILPEDLYNSGQEYNIKFREKRVEMYDYYGKILLGKANSIKELCNKYNLNESCVVEVLNEKQSHHKTFTFKRV